MSSESSDSSVSYLEYTKQQLIAELHKKQKTIAQLMNVNKNAPEETAVYRQKLQEQIEQNQKAIKYFQELNVSINALLQKFDLNKKQTDTCKSKIVSELDKNHSILSSVNECFDQDYLSSINQNNCLQEITKETLNSLNKLQNGINLLIQQNKSLNAKKSYLSTAEAEKEMHKQIKQLKQEIKILRDLLKNLQRDYCALIKQVSQAKSIDQLVQMQKMDKNGLINLNKCLAYNIEQLKKQKKEVMIKHQQEKDNQKYKYAKLLDELKKQRVSTLKN